MRQLSLAAPLLISACVASLPPEGTPYVSIFDGGDNLYAPSTITYFLDGTVHHVADPHPENGNRGVADISLSPGTYEVALTAMDAPTQRELAAEARYNAIDPNEAHVWYFRECTWFDGTVSRIVPNYVCNRASNFAAANRSR